MRSLSFVLAFSVFTAVFGCGGTESANKTQAGNQGPASLRRFDHSEVDATLLPGRTFIGKGLSNPVAIGVVGAYVVVADETRSDSMVKVYDRQSGRLEFATGRVGNGPGEFRSIWDIRPAWGNPPDRPEAWVFDYSLRRATEFDLSRAGQQLESRSRPMIRLQPNATMTSAAWGNDSTIVALGFFLGGRLGVFNRDGKQTKTLGPLPTDAPDIPPAVSQHAYQSFLGVKPDGTMLVVANRHAGRLELLRPTGERVAIVRGPYYFEPVFQVAKGSDSAKSPIFSSGDDLRFSYVGVAVTDKAIYALFSGRIRKDPRGEASYGQYLHVFDWSGNFVRAYDLGQPALTMDIDPSGHFLYAVRHSPDVAIMVYGLN